MTSDLDAMRERYARRQSLSAERYSLFSADVLARVQERQRAIVSLLYRQGHGALADWQVIEVGCGTGGNLLELIALGATPHNLVGNELLDDRVAMARQRLPEAVRLWPGDATNLPLTEKSFDLVYQSTVFSSILDDAAQAALAYAMWRWLKPGGAVLWYDFTYDNPANPDVRGVALKRVRELFPEGGVDARRVTLAPPLARAVCKLHPMLYPVFNALPLLRTHLLAWIEKPR